MVRIQNNMILGKDINDLKALSVDPLLKKLLMDDIGALSKQHKLSGLEKPRDIWVSFDQFTIENNLLTPTFKLKRNVVQQVYEQEIAHMYERLD